MTEPHPSLALDAETLLAHSAWLAKFARALVANDADVDDVVQQTYATALARPPRHTGNLRGWLGTVARNVVRSGARSDSARAAREVAVPPPPPVEDPVEAVARAELRKKVVECVLALDEPYRSTVILRFFEEQEVRVVARLTKTNEDTVRTRLRRGVIRVRELLERKVDEETRGDAREGAAARALLMFRLQSIAANGGGPTSPGGGGAPGRTAVSRGVGRSTVVQTTRWVVVGATVAVVAGAGWWWDGTRREPSRTTPAVASRADLDGVSSVHEAAPPAVVPERSTDAQPMPPPPTPPVAAAPRPANRGILRGVIAAPDGTPVAGAYVWALMSPTHETEYLMPAFGKMARGQVEGDAVQHLSGTYLETRSGDGGRFEFRDLPTMPGWAIGAYEPTIGATATEVFDFDHEHREISAEVRLIRGTRLRGTVRDENGALVGGARVFAFTTCNKERWTTSTEANPVGPRLGEFDLDFQCGEPILIGCGTPTFVSTDRTTIKIEPGTKETAFQFTLKRRPGILVRGRILDPKGERVDLETLLKERFASDQPDLRWGRVGLWAVATGAKPPPVLLSGMPPPKGFIEGKVDHVGGRYEVVVPETFRGSIELRVFKTVLGTEPLDDPHAPPDLECDEERLPREGVLTKFAVQYVDAETKQPIDLEKESTIPPLIDAERSAPIVRGECDLRRGVVKYECSPGTMSLEPAIRGYATSRFLVDVPRATHDLPTTIEVPPAIAGVHGLALHEDGRRFARAEISIHRASPSGWIETTGGRTVTNDDGEFEFEGLAKAEHAIVVSGQPDEAPGVVRFVASDPYPELEVRTSLGRAVRFRILGKQTDRETPPNPYFRVFDRDGVPIENLHSHWARVSKSPVEVTLRLLDGRYTVAVERYGFRESRVDFDVPRESLDVQLEHLDVDWK